MPREIKIIFNYKHKTIPDEIEMFAMEFANYTERIMRKSGILMYKNKKIDLTMVESIKIIFL